MAVTIKSGFRKLVEDVQSFFDAYDLGTKVSVGWKERAKQSNQGQGRANRVVFMPGDSSGKGGRIIQPMQPGKRPIGNPQTPEAFVRPLRDWQRTLAVAVWAYDPAAPNDELAQIDATESLFEWTMRAVHYSVYADAIWGDVNWIPVSERQFGSELVAGLTFRHPLFDVPTETVFPTAVVNKGSIT